MTPEPDVRQELVARVRQEIRAGTYDTPEKFEAALDRLATCLDLG
ncbi:MAG TPA: flagellar biosynthesis anti-sigma factor FlgM [Gemmataceae bacterium]|nr:flagellar biosynthesis anti-sigma factor FlgM [Gemmataceae bacterium]